MIAHSGQIGVRKRNLPVLSIANMSFSYHRDAGFISLDKGDCR
jgi:hypothetical protein